MPTRNKRRRFLLRMTGAVGVAFTAGCQKLSTSEWFPKVLGSTEKLTSGAQHLVTSRKSMAQEFSEKDLSPSFRSNGTASPNNPAYQALAAKGFADWQLEVNGLVDTPLKLSLAELRAMPSRTQITRHDCVEGWSAIGKWTGVQLTEVLALAKPKANAKFVVFHCADPMEEDGTNPYYESVDMEDAHHPQTILAYEMNGAVLPVANGAPIRLRVERQLGYKHAKYVMRIELVESFTHIQRGKGGYWEDEGYQWYAGI
jgi:DMSO/TMAO reductase YedYZ molybdopterin-dependent catalytic subunit